jgi:hypothetical protein
MDKLILEGDLAYGVYNWEDFFETIDGKDLITAISDFLGEPDINDGNWRNSKTVYKDIRITIERLDVA